jgi:threonine/homoserine/homoserine lactone efflux protein
MARADRGAVLMATRGLVVNLTNPKSFVFFGAVFAALLPTHATVAERAAAVAVITIDSLAFHALLALLLSAGHARAFYRRFRRPVSRAVGAAYLAFGARLAAAAARTGASW